MSQIKPSKPDDTSAPGPVEPAEEHPEQMLQIGWREFISLPDWGVEHILAKSDTGAKASAIDVANLEELDNGRARFEVITERASKGHPQKSVIVEAPISRIKTVRSSNGHSMHRIAVKTLMQIGPINQEVEFSLVCRRHMLCRVLLGRTALQQHFLVNSGKRYLLSETPPEHKKRLRSKNKNKRQKREADRNSA